MPRQYSHGGKKAPGSFERKPDGSSLPSTTSFKERLGALKNVGPFVAMVWRTSPGLTLATFLLRFTRALLPVATLYVGKLIIDDVVLLVQMPEKPLTLSGLVCRPDT